MRLSSIPFLSIITPLTGGGSVVFRGATYQAGSGTITPSLPSGVLATDTLFAFVFAAYSGATSAAVDTMAAPSGWTAGTGRVADPDQASTDAAGARFFTAPGNVGTLTFTQAGITGVVLVAVSAPLRAGSDMQGINYANTPGPDLPGGSVTAVAGDCAVSVLVQLDNGAGGAITGTPTAGYTRELFSNAAEPYISVLAQEGMAAGATGPISHGQNADYSTRFVFSGVFGA